MVSEMHTQPLSEVPLGRSLKPLSEVPSGSLKSPLGGYVIGAGRTISSCEPLPRTTGGLHLEAKRTEIYLSITSALFIEAF